VLLPLEGEVLRDGGEAKRLRAIEEENRQLKHAVVAMRSEVAVSERRACGLMEIHSGTYRYRPRPEERRLRLRLRELAAQRRRFGFRRFQVLLVREGWEVTTSVCTGSTWRRS